ncbi:unnamed protein product [Peronospora destructor]|uniref:Uncharacterized protein n=1 Tax=Peronospora destructor TaxID=86335 RepID=A0AAV0T1Q2_9STRA|nr:unnamed protein product [Peronospora destructor]
MGELIHKFHPEEMNDRFYYFGGSVREFTLAEYDDQIDAIDFAINSVKDVSSLLNNMLSFSARGSQVDRLRHTFLKSTDDIAPLFSKEWWEPFIYMSCWELTIDSEYVVRCLSVRLPSDALFKMYTWAKNNGNNSLAGAVYEILLHRLAADNQLDLYISEYDPQEKHKPNAPRHLKVEKVRLEKHSATCSGTASDHVAHLTKWRDDERFSYWFPGACPDFPNINSIVKLKSTSGRAMFGSAANAANGAINDVLLTMLPPSSHYRRK